MGGSPTQFTPPTAENDREGPRATSILDRILQGPGALGLPGMGFPGIGIPGIPSMGFGSGFGFGGMFADPTVNYAGPGNPWLGETDEKWGEVEQTTLDTLEQSNMLRQYGDDAVLVVANGPEDMQQLNHEDEANRIAESRGEGQQTVVLWNPSPEALTGMLQEGGFKDVVFSGHGEEGVVYMTGEDGEAVAVDGDELAGMMEDTNVQNVFLNVCHGMGGEDSVAEALASTGINTMGWMESVSDGMARQGAEMWAGFTRDGGSMSDFLATAQNFSGMEARWGNGNFELPPGLFGGLRNLFGGGPGPTPAAEPTPAVEPTPAPKQAPAKPSLVDKAVDVGVDMFDWAGGLWV